MTDPTRLNEYNLSEKPAIDLLKRMGYTYSYPLDAGDAHSTRYSMAFVDFQATKTESV
jgi:hypothetical protein